MDVSCTRVMCNGLSRESEKLPSFGNVNFKNLKLQFVHVGHRLRLVADLDLHDHHAPHSRRRIHYFCACFVRVVCNGDELDFSVGFASSSFPLNNFFVSPRCDCRLNYDNEDNEEFRVRKLQLRISCRQGALEVGKKSSKP
ncbi:hypothetical protein HN51_061454, partial [Arachis hypogaea]